MPQAFGHRISDSESPYRVLLYDACPLADGRTKLVNGRWLELPRDHESDRIPPVVILPPTNQGVYGLEEGRGYSHPLEGACLLGSWHQRECELHEAEIRCAAVRTSARVPVYDDNRPRPTHYLQARKARRLRGVRRYHAERRRWRAEPVHAQPGPIGKLPR